MWVDYRGPLSTVYNDGVVSTCGWIIEVHSVQSTMIGRSQHVGGLYIHNSIERVGLTRNTCSEYMKENVP